MSVKAVDANKDIIIKEPGGSKTSYHLSNHDRRKGATTNAATPGHHPSTLSISKVAVNPSDATVPATLLSIPLRSYGSPFHIAVCFRTKYSTEDHIIQQKVGVQERQPRTRGHLSYQYRSVTGYSLLIVFLDVFDEVDNEPGRGNEEGILTGRCIVHRSNL